MVSKEFEVHVDCSRSFTTLEQANLDYLLVKRRVWRNINAASYLLLTTLLVYICCLPFFEIKSLYEKMILFAHITDVYLIIFIALFFSCKIILKAYQATWELEPASLVSVNRHATASRVYSLHHHPSQKRMHQVQNWPTLSLPIRRPNVNSHIMNNEFFVL